MSERSFFGLNTRATGPRHTVSGVLLVLLLFSSAGWAQEGKAEKAAHPYLGILVSPAEGGESGIVVREVTADSPAAKAGLKSGDRIIKIEDQEVQDVERFLKTVASKKPGDKLTLRVVRAGQEQNITATLGERPGTPEPPAFGRPDRPGFPRGPRPAFLGVQTQPLTPELKQRLQAKTEAGVVVTEVVPNSPAAKAGLKPDDVITAVNDKTIRDPAQLRETIQQIGSGKEVTVQVARGNENLSLKAKLGEGGFGLFRPPGDERFPMLDVESLFATARRVQELERRVEELEKRVRELERKNPRSPR